VWPSAAGVVVRGVGEVSIYAELGEGVPPTQGAQGGESYGLGSGVVDNRVPSKDGVIGADLTGSPQR
jgi:hypothetical protein